MNRLIYWVKSLSVFLLLFASPVLAQQVEKIAEGIELFESKQLQKAKVIFQSCPNDHRSAYYLGRIFYEQQDYQNAVNWLEKAISLKDDESVYYYWLAKTYTKFGYQANVWKRIAGAKKVKKLLLQSLALNADNLDARELLLKYYLDLSGIMGGSIDKALEQAVEIIKRDVKQGHFAYIRIYSEQKNFDLLEKEYLALIKLEPNERKHQIALAGIHYDQQKTQQARIFLLNLLNQYPDDMLLRYEIGSETGYYGRDLELAEQCYKAYLQHEPKEGMPTKADVHYGLGYVYKKKGAIEFARAEFNTVLTLEPKNEFAKRALEKLEEK